MTTLQQLAEELFENSEWRADQNIAAGRKLTVAEMYAQAESQAAGLFEAYQRAETVVAARHQ